VKEGWVHGWKEEKKKKRKNRSNSFCDDAGRRQQGERERPGEREGTAKRERREVIDPPLLLVLF